MRPVKRGDGRVRASRKGQLPEGRLWTADAEAAPCQFLLSLPCLVHLSQFDF